MRGMVCLLLALAGAATLKTEVSPVQKVIELLDGLKGKVQADLEAEETLMSEYTQWCDSEANEKTDAIRSGKRTSNDLKATIQSSDARIAELSTEIEELATKLATAGGELKSATSIRDEEHSDFSKSEKELSETIDTLAKANVVLSRGQSFMQNGKGLNALANGLSKIIEANWVNSQQRSVVQSLIQSSTEADDEDLSLQPQASTAAFTSQGGGILDTLKDMQGKAEGTLTDSRQAEMKSNHAFAMLKQSLETEIKSNSDRKNAADIERSATQQARNEADTQLSAIQNTLASDEKYLADLNINCAAKASEWESRQKSAGEEIAVIEKAKEILSEGVKVFLQMNTATKDDEEKREQVSTLLKNLAKKDHVYGLAQLASAARSDPFGKVRGLVENMIDRLQKEAAEEADGKAFCDTEISKSRAKQADLSAKLDMHSARIAKASAGIEELKAQTKALSESMAEMDSAQAEATKIRQEENSEYQKASKDQRDSADAVANAVEVLQAYYSQGSFVQASQAPEMGGAKTDVAGTIISILEVAESDFTRMLAESESQETAAKAQFEKMMKENAVARAASEQEVKGNEDEIKALEMSLLNYKEDQGSANKELDAVMEYLDSLKPQCESKVMSYAERKSRRESEIEGLKEALEILTK